MKVICIRAATRNDVTKLPLKSSTIVGQTYTVDGDDPTDCEYYTFAEFPYTLTFRSFYKRNFIPLSEIDETEMLREFQKRQKEVPASIRAAINEGTKKMFSKTPTKL